MLNQHSDIVALHNYLTRPEWNLTHFPLAHKDTDHVTLSDVTASLLALLILDVQCYNTNIFQIS